MAGDDAVHDHHGLEVLSTEECHELLAARPIGRVAFVEAGEAVVLPVTYRYHQHRVVFLTGSGAKLSTAAMGGPVSFEVDDWDEEAQRGWSVLVKGTAEEVMEPDEVAELDALGHQPWLDPAPAQWVRIIANEITGRRIA